MSWQGASWFAAPDVLAGLSSSSSAQPLLAARNVAGAGDEATATSPKGKGKTKRKTGGDNNNQSERKNKENLARTVYTCMPS